MELQLTIMLIDDLLNASFMNKYFKIFNILYFLLFQKLNDAYKNFEKL